MTLDNIPGKKVFAQRDVRETPAGTTSSSSSTSILAPVGSIMPWLKSFANTPQALPTGWMEADGSAINDADSVYDGQNAPDLDGGEFIRGAGTSGGTGGSDTMAHTHTTNVTIDNHNAIAINNHTSLTLSNHAALNIANDSHSHNLGSNAHAEIGGDEGSPIRWKSVSHSYTADRKILTVGQTTEVAVESDGETVGTALDGTTDSDTHNHNFSQNIDAHSFSQNISAHSIGTNIDAHTENNPATSAASNDANIPKYYNVVWIFRFK